jgi:N-glycosylase/DNA lyase
VSIELLGAGCEPVDFARTLLSHGVADLPPNTIAPDGSSLETVLPADGRAWTVRLVPDGPRRARVEFPGPGAPRRGATRDALLGAIRHMLRLDDDLSGFYATAADDPLLAWVTSGAGRMLRSPTVFEDVVKTICTTNCAWSGTVRMVSALVGELGMGVQGAPERRTFPTPEAMAEVDESFYRDVARAGYRGAYLRSLARQVADAELDLEGLADRGLSDEEVAARLQAIAGVGPYATAHIMMLLGRYGKLVLDSWSRPKYRRVAERPRVTDKGIERAFRRYREFAGLAFWLTVTQDWVTPTAPGVSV